MASNVEQVERQLKPQEESNRTEQMTAPQILSENSNVETGKHRRKRPAKFDDYHEGTPSPCTVSHGSSGCADVATCTHENEQRAVIEDPAAIEFDEFLDKLYRTNRHEPPLNVSHWNKDHNDKMIQQYFKMKRFTVTPDAFITRYVFSGNENLYKGTMGRAAEEMSPILNYLDKSIFIDFSEENLFLSKEYPDEQSQRMNREFVAQGISNSIHRMRKMSHLLDGVPFNLCGKMERRLAVLTEVWVDRVALALEAHPSEVCESTYEDIFRSYLDIFGWACQIGKTVKLAIPYRGTKIFSVPDILARKVGSQARNRAVVEVKRMSLDPCFKHALNKQGILSKSKEGVKRPKIKHVDFKSEEASTVEQSEQDDTDVEDEHQLQKGQSRISTYQRKFIKLFFGQLFGSVLAMDCCYPQSSPTPLLGIGVVGFRVVFFTFCAEPPCQLKDITRDPNSKVNVYMTSELSLLKASDRRKINEILLPLSAFEPRPMSV